MVGHSLRYVLRLCETPIEQYALVCAQLVTATWKLVCFNSAKMGFSWRLLHYHTIFPSDYTLPNSTRFLSERPLVVSTSEGSVRRSVFSHSQSLTMTSYFQVKVPSHRPRETLKSSVL